MLQANELPGLLGLGNVELLDCIKRPMTPASDHEQSVTQRAATMVDSCLEERPLGSPLLCLQIEAVHCVLEVAQSELDVLVFQPTSSQVDVLITNIGDCPPVNGLLQGWSALLTDSATVEKTGVLS